MYFQMRTHNTWFFVRRWFFQLCDQGGNVIMQSALYDKRNDAIDAIHTAHKQLRKQHGPTVRGFR